MNFSIINPEQKQHDRVGEFERFLRNRRRQFQDWEASPPHLLGWLLFAAAVVELVLARRLAHGQGGVGQMGRQLALTAGVLLASEILVCAATSLGGRFFEKKGRARVLLTFLNLSLVPLLLFLPLTLFTWSAGLTAARPLFFLILALAVFLHWIDAMQVSYELSSRESAQILFYTFAFGLSAITLLMSLSLYGLFGALLAG